MSSEIRSLDILIQLLPKSRIVLKFLQSVLFLIIVSYCPVVDHCEMLLIYPGNIAGRWEGRRR